MKNISILFRSLTQIIIDAELLLCGRAPARGMGRPRAGAAAAVGRLWRLAAAACVFVAGGAMALADLNTGLVAYYPLTGNANDESGSGHNASIYGAVPAPDRLGQPNRAYSFNGSAYMDIGNPVPLRLTNDITIAAWVKFSGGDHSPRIISYAGNYPSDYFGYELLTSGAGNPRKFAFYCGRAGVTGVKTVAENEWHHVTAVGTSNSVSIYVDGSLDVTASGVANPFYFDSCPLYIGRKSGYTTDYWGGSLDEIRLYGRALSATEVAQLYALGGGAVSVVVSNVRAQQRQGAKLVDIVYDLTSPQGIPVNVSVGVSTNNGTSYSLPASSFSGSGYGTNVTPGNSRQITWDAGADWNNHFSSQVKFRVTANGTLSDNSPAVTVNTGDRDRPMVADVTSAYCGASRHAYFLNGVSLPLEFTVSTDWNKKAPGSIHFIGPWGTSTNTGTQTKRTFNVGTDFGVGENLSVKLVAADGTESWPLPVNFDVISTPLGLPSAAVSTVPNSENAEYSATFNSVLIDEGVDALGGSGSTIPFIGGEPIRIRVGPPVRFTISSDGTAFSSVSLNSGNAEIGINLKLTKHFPTLFPSYSHNISMRYEPTLGQWAASGTASCGLDVEVSSPPYPFVVPIGPVLIPCFVEAYGRGGFSGEVKIGTWDSYQNVPRYSGGTIDLHAAVGAVAAVGFDELAYFGFYGQLGISYLLTFPSPPSGEVDFQGEVGFTCGLMGFIEVNVKLWPTDEAAARMISKALLPQGLSDYSRFKTPDRSYLKRRAYGAMDVDSDSAAEVLRANIYPYSDCALAVQGERKLLVWLADDPIRSPENRSELVWQVSTGSTWTAEQAIWDDGTADFKPQVGILEDGRALCVWQNVRSVLASGAGLTQALTASEIAVGILATNSTVWVASNLTVNAVVDRSPRLAIGPSNRALVSWVENDYTNHLGTTALPNRLVWAAFDGQAWSAQQTLATNVGMLLWSRVAFDGTNGAFLATIDPDDDQSSIDDHELWGASFDGLTWTPLFRLTTNTVQDTKPQAVYDSSGRLVVVWYQDTNLVMHVGDLNLASPTVVGQLSGSSSQKDFHLVTGPGGQISLVWEDLAADGSGPDPMLLNYDPALEVWSQPVRLVSNTNELERSFSGAYTDGGDLLLAYNRVAVSYDTNNVPQFGQVDLMFMDYSIGEDLGVSSSDINLSTNNPAPGQSVTLTALVSNLGELAATNVQVAFYDGNPASGGSLIGSTQAVAGVLVAGSNVLVQVTWTVPLTVSERTLYVVVDPALKQPDRNRGNNTAMRTALTPVVQIGEMSVLQTSATNRIVVARVVNTGVIPSGASLDVVFHRWATNGPVLATVPIGILPNNGAYDASFEWNLAGLTFTNAFELVYAIADPDNLVAGVDRVKNVRMVQVMTALDSDNDGVLDGEALRYGTNLPPTDVILSGSGAPEDQPPGATVGTLTTIDPNPQNTSFSYGLVPGAGSTDNALFSIVGSALQTAATFDYEVKNTYTIRVRTMNPLGLTYDKAFTIAVTDVNLAPTNIVLAAGIVPEKQPPGTIVGTFSTQDPESPAEPFTYAPAIGIGDTDNGSFTITGNMLKTAAVLDYATKSAYSIRVRSTDLGGLSCEKIFTIRLSAAPANGTISINNGRRSTGLLVVTLNNLGATERGSILSQMQFSNDGQAWSEWELYSTTRLNWDLSLFGGNRAYGTKQVFVRYKDEAREVSEAFSASIDHGAVAAWGDSSAGQTDVEPWLTNVTAVAAGAYHSLALKADGTVVAWGDNSRGQRDVPTDLTNVVVIAAGGFQSLALTGEGTVVAWGGVRTGEVPSDLARVIAIAAGGDHCLALQEDGTVRGWGNGEGADVPDDLEGVVAIAAGSYHSLALKGDGTVKAWGEDWCDVCEVPGDLTDVIAIAAGTCHSLALKADGAVVEWGDLGEGGPCEAPSDLTNIVAIAAGGENSLAVRNDGSVVGWDLEGRELSLPRGLTNVNGIACGELHCLAIVGGGGGAPRIVRQPLDAVIYPMGRAVLLVSVWRTAVPCTFQWRFNGVDISGATGSSLVLDGVRLSDAGRYSVVVSNAFGVVISREAVLSVCPVVAWGYNENGETEVPLGLTNVLAIAGGDAHSLALKGDGTVVGWGWNGDGQAVAPAGLSDVVAIAGGGNHSLAVKGDGTVVAWGWNDDGQANVPRGLSDVVAVAAGRTHSLALNRDGTVAAWGSDSDGQTDVPQGLSSVAAIAGGEAHSLALKGDGTVVAWGSDGDGQATVPPGLSNVVAVAAGGAHSLALRNDGGVVAWGYYDDGWDWIPMAAPVGLTNVVAIAARGDHDLALVGDGTVVAWGYNGDGETNVPSGLSNVVAVSAGGSHSLALVGDGRPFIFAQPGSYAGGLGSTVCFQVSARSAVAIGYQWTYNGSNQEGENNSTLCFTNVQAGNLGTYAVIITNAYGSVTSKVATLTVALTVNGIAANNKVYDGGTAATLDTSSASLVGVLAEDLGNVTLVTGGATGRFADKNAGTGKTVIVSGLTLSGSAAGRYSVVKPVVSANIAAAGSMTVLLSSGNPVVYGGSATFTGTVTGVPSAADSPTGDIVFFTNGVPLRTNALVGGSASASTTLLSLGTNTVSAQYAGDGNFLWSDASLEQVVQPRCSDTNAVLGIAQNLDGTLALAFLGTPGAQYCVVWQTNATEPMVNWQVLANSTNSVTDGSGFWSITVEKTGESRFYRSKALSVCSATAAGLVAYYPFNGNANDEGGNAHHATVYGAALAPDRFSQPNKAYSFNGSSAYMGLANPLPLRITNNFTFAAWVNFTGGTENPRFISYGGNSPNDYYGYEFLTSGTGNPRKLFFIFGHVWVYGVTNVSANVWHHVAAVGTPTSAAIYVDGALDATASGLADPFNFGGSPLYIGAKAPNESDYYSGVLDEVRIYDRALSGSAIKQLYDLGQ